MLKKKEAKPTPDANLESTTQKAEDVTNEAEQNTEENGKPQKISGLGTVVVRNEFYRDGYRTLLKMTLVQSLAILAMIGAMYYMITNNKPQNFYFATTEDGRLIPMVPLSQPNLSTPALMSWVAQAATEVMTFSFNDYRRRLQESSRNFTKRGWESFTQALQRSRIIEMLEVNQQMITAAPSGAPVLEQEAMVAGRYQWVVQIPLVITYRSGAKTRSNRVIVRMVIVRVPRLESPSGIGIEQWIATSG